MNRLRRIVAVVLLVLAPVLAPLVANIQQALAAVDTCTWTGTTNNAWATATNWTGCDSGNVPENGDTLVFPQTASNKAMNNNVVGLQPQFMTISGTGYTFSGSAITLAGASNGITASESATIGVGITFSGTNNTNTVSATKTLAFTSTVTYALSGGSTWNGGGASTIAGAVTGSVTGTIMATSAGSSLELDGTGNTFTAGHVGGDTDATFICGSITCFGNVANIIYSGGGIVRLNVASTYSNPIETSTTTASDSWIKAYVTATLSGATAITDALNVGEYGTASTLTFSNTIAIGSASSIAAFGNSSTDSTITLSSTVSGATGSVAATNVLLILAGANTYVGTTTVNPGAVISAKTATAFGSATGATTVLSGGAALFDAAASTTYTENFNIAGTGITNNGALYTAANNVTKLNGTINLTADALVAQRSTVCTGTPTLQLNGLISGTGNLTTQVTNNACRMVIGDTAVVAGANTFSGILTHIGGFLDLNKDLAAPHNAILAPTNSGISTVVTLLAPSTNAVGGTMSTVSNNNANDYWSVLNSETASEISSTTGQDGLNFCKGQTFTLNQATDTTFNGAFGLATGCTGADPLFTKLGVGTLSLTRDKTVGVMNIAVTAGTLSVNANFSDAAFFINGGTLKGVSTLGAVTGTSGHFAPGNSPGCVTAASLTLNSGFNYDEELGGTTACSGYDQTTVTGAATLGNATLATTQYAGFVPAIGDTYTILRAGSISGTFNGMPNNTTFTVSGVNYRITYTATTVTLTVVLASAAVTTTAATLANTGTPIIATTILAASMIMLAVGVSRFKKPKTSLVKSL